jgi:hypothetical protein
LVWSSTIEVFLSEKISLSRSSNLFRELHRRESSNHHIPVMKAAIGVWLVSFVSVSMFRGYYKKDCFGVNTYIGDYYSQRKNWDQCMHPNSRLSYLRFWISPKRNKARKWEKIKFIISFVKKGFWWNLIFYRHKCERCRKGVVVSMKWGVAISSTSSRHAAHSLLVLRVPGLPLQLVSV